MVRMNQGRELILKGENHEAKRKRRKKTEAEIDARAKGKDRAGHHSPELQLGSADRGEQLPGGPYQADPSLLW